MREYKIEKVEVEEKTLDSVICNVCKRKYKWPEEEMEIQEFHRIHFVGGYASVFGDCVEMEGDICQHCLDEKLGEYLVAVNIQE